MLLSETINLFLENKRATTSESAATWYKWVLLELRKAHGERDLNRITASDLAQFLAAQRERPSKGYYRGQLSPMSIKHLVRALRTFFRWCTASKLLSEDPSVLLKAPRVNRRDRALTPKELYTIMTALVEAETTPQPYVGWRYVKRDFALICVMLDTGARSKEVSALAVKDLHLDEQYIVIESGKGQKRRLVPLGRRTVSLLREYLGKRISGPVFLSEKGKALGKDGLRQIMRRLGARVGFPIQAHQLRHSFASQWLLSGQSPELLQAVMGHESWDTTRIYTRLAIEQMALQVGRRHSLMDRMLEAVKPGQVPSPSRSREELAGEQT